VLPQQLANVEMDPVSPVQPAAQPVSPVVTEEGLGKVDADPRKGPPQDRGWTAKSGTTKLWCVADGHGPTAEVAARLQTALNDRLCAELDSLPDLAAVERALEGAIERVDKAYNHDYELVSLQHQQAVSQGVPAMAQAYHLQQRLYELGSSGSTISVLCAHKHGLAFAHLGDSRIYMLPQAGGARLLTTDHDLDCPDEVARIRALPQNVRDCVRRVFPDNTQKSPANGEASCSCRGSELRVRRRRVATRGETRGQQGRDLPSPSIRRAL
jgi:serine/threonine protein phosphatase PrpC